MRYWLQNSQIILASASEKYFKKIIRTAKASDVTSETKAPASLLRKIALVLKKLGLNTRKKLDKITIDADRIKDNELTTRQSSITLNNRIDCHATCYFDDTGCFDDTGPFTDIKK